MTRKLWQKLNSNAETIYIRLYMISHFEFRFWRVIENLKLNFIESMLEPFLSQ